MERSDLGRGEFDTSIGALARGSRRRLPPRVPCTIAAMPWSSMDARSLPASASIARDYDVLTQGIIAKAWSTVLIRGNESRGFVLLDVFRTPAASSTAALGGLAEQIRPSNFAVIGASNDGASEGPTAASWLCAIRRQRARQASTVRERHPPPPGQGRCRDGAVHSGDGSLAGRAGRATQAAPSPAPAPAASTAMPSPPPPAPPPRPAILAPPAAPPSR